MKDVWLDDAAFHENGPKYAAASNLRVCLLLLSSFDFLKLVAYISRRGATILDHGLGTVGCERERGHQRDHGHGHKRADRGAAPDRDLTCPLSWKTFSILSAARNTVFGEHWSCQKLHTMSLSGTFNESAVMTARAISTLSNIISKFSLFHTRRSISFRRGKIWGVSLAIRLGDL